ncbi:hypothetical protein [Pandoraea oxalativorans]|uniref:Uncharacterized protein n=1 Tax=Pandoraea oxalativorans TaxID=573737 RepID=A0A0G3IDH1_9BURK|nr:hypothetical protein [Pandoraea oxalativorans]AKK24648.1 hypothetical protein MB84_27815 [Pandoraea oxalativorans]
MHFDTAIAKINNNATIAFPTKELDKNLKKRLETLNFNDPLAVKELHEIVAKTTLVEKICDVFFYGGELRACHKACTTLFFFKIAERRGQPMDHIPGTREEALKTVATWMSPVAQTELLAAVKDQSISNAFSMYFSVHDRYFLAAKVLLIQEAAMPDKDAKDGPGKMTHSHVKLQAAADHFRTAGLYYANQAKNPALAIASFQLAQNAYRDVRWLSQVAECKQAVGAVLGKKGLNGEAAEAFIDSAKTFEETAADYEKQGDKHFVRVFTQSAAIMYKTGAKFFEKDKKPVDAGDHFMKCADLYRAIGDHARAKKNYQKAVDCYNKGGPSEKLTLAKEQVQERSQPAA